MRLVFILFNVVGYFCNMKRLKVRGIINLLSLLLMVSACTQEDIVTVMDGIMPVSRVQIDLGSNESLTVETARVIVFDRNGKRVSNTLLQVAAENFSLENGACKLTLASNEFQARLGTNHIYVVLNEGTGGEEIVDRLNSVSTSAEMEEIRRLPVNYTGLLEVEPDKEPAFLMCVHDDVSVASGSSPIDITGLDANSYGFSMRRTMAKVVLESIWGGVKPDGKILGTDILYNPSLSTDQTGSDDIVAIDVNGNMSGVNKKLAATSEVFVTKVELINVPNKYSWFQEEDDTQDAVLYDGGYLESQDITSGFTLNGDYLSRDWYGNIKVDGTVDFIRIDALPAFWRQSEKSSGSGSYALQEAYAFATKWEEDNYSTNGPYIINSGNFVPWVKENYGKGQYEPGEIIPENLKLRSNLNPAAWSIDGGGAYYIPENIQDNSSKQTKLRVHFSIASIMATLTEKELQEKINQVITDKQVPIVREDGVDLIINSNDNWQSAGITYVRNQGKYVKNPSTVGDGKLLDGTPISKDKDQEWGVCYEGIKTKISGKGVAVDNRDGYYIVDVKNVSKNLYIDVPLSNYDESKNSGANDNNIYRGHEYRVQLYVTREGAWNNASTAGRTIQVGGEELVIVGKVVATPMK